MAEAGERFEFPDGSVYVVETPSAATGGEFVEMTFILPADCVAPLPHVHPQQTEEYEVVEGSLDVMVDGEWSTIQRGERATVPVGVLHTFRNSTGAEITVRNWHRPAVRFEEFIERTTATLREAGIKSGKDPRALMILSASMLSYPETLAPARKRERIPMKLLATTGRLLRLPS